MQHTSSGRAGSELKDRWMFIYIVNPRAGLQVVDTNK